MRPPAFEVKFQNRKDYVTEMDTDSLHGLSLYGSDGSDHRNQGACGG